MTETVKRGPKRITTDYGMYDYQKYYTEKYGKGISRLTYNKVISEFNKELIQILLNDSDDYVMPVIKLKLGIRKDKRVPSIRDGKLYINAPVDWEKTRKLWNTDNEAKENKTLIRYTNYHTSGYVFRVYMFKFGVRLKNRSVYKFKTSRYFQRILAKRIKDTNKDKFDAYLLYKVTKRKS